MTLPMVPPHEVWANEIGDIPTAQTFVYVVAIADWFSCKALMTEPA